MHRLPWQIIFRGLQYSQWVNARRESLRPSLVCQREFELLPAELKWLLVPQTITCIKRGHKYSKWNSACFVIQSCSKSHPPLGHRHWHGVSLDRCVSWAPFSVSHLSPARCCPWRQAKRRKKKDPIVQAPCFFHVMDSWTWNSQWTSYGKESVQIISPSSRQFGRRYL